MTLTTDTADIRYVYTDEEHNILAITGTPYELMERDNTKIRHELELPEVANLLSGKYSMHQYTVEPDKNNPLKMTIVKKSYTVNRTRMLDKFLTEITSDIDVEPQIIITHNIKDKKLIISLREEFRKKLLGGKTNRKQITIMGVTELVLYATKKNDPSLLYRTFNIRVIQLLRRGRVTVSYDDDLSNVSIFTKKIFPNYIYEVVDE